MKLANTDGNYPWATGWAIVAPGGGSPGLEYSPDNGTTWFAVPDGQGGDLSSVTVPTPAIIPSDVLIRVSGTGAVFINKGSSPTSPRK